MLLGILKFFLKAKPLSKDELNLDNVENILIVRQHNQLGDMLCSVPLFAALRERFPKAHITLVASPINYEILFSDINPYINEVITYNKSGLKNIYAFAKTLRKRKYRVGIVPSTVSVSRTSHLINYLSKAEIKVGVKSIDGKYNVNEFLLNVKSDFDWDKEKFHQMERNLDIGRQIGCDLKPEDRRIRIALSEDERNFADGFIESNFPDKKRPVIALHPGAGKIPNRWSVDNFTKLAQKLNEKYNNYTLITSGHIDAEVTNELSSRLNELRIDNVILDDTPVRKVGAVIARADIYITNDTGVMHVAEGVGANIISLFGPTHAYEWAPKGEHNIPIQSPTDNIQDITVDEVFNAAQTLIKEVEA